MEPEVAFIIGLFIGIVLTVKYLKIREALLIQGAIKFSIRGAEVRIRQQRRLLAVADVNVSKETEAASSEDRRPARSTSKTSAMSECDFCSGQPVTIAGTIMPCPKCKKLPA